MTTLAKSPGKPAQLSAEISRIPGFPVDKWAVYGFDNGAVPPATPVFGARFQTADDLTLTGPQIAAVTSVVNNHVPATDTAQLPGPEYVVLVNLLKQEIGGTAMTLAQARQAIIALMRLQLRQLAQHGQIDGTTI